jgi:UDP-N-acetylmuramoyl-tripeptide--D-alanyl-D-alanine ligase
MAAVAVGLHFGVEPWDIKEAIEEYVPSNQRSEYKETARGNRLYLDCYNANPSSMAAAIASFSSNQAIKQSSNKMMAIIGGMHELGHDEHKEHKHVVAQLAECGLERVLLVGPEWDGLALPAAMQRFADTERVREWLGENPVTGATILIKGSNTNRLWTLEERL